MGNSHLTSPRTYLVGSTHIDLPGLREYLIDTNQLDFIQSVNEALADGLHEGEILCSTAAKLCYKSLVLGQNANVTKTRDIKENLAACIQAGHSSIWGHLVLNFITTNCSRLFCYAPDSELFTGQGWKKIQDITPHDVLLTMNPVTHKARWSNPLSVHSFDYKGGLYWWNNSQMCSPMMTRDHLLWAAPYDLRRAQGLTNQENMEKFASKIPLNELFGKRFAIDHGVRWDAENDVEEITIGSYTYNAYDLYSWLGWMATDGGFCKARQNQCTIVQSKSKNLPIIERMMNRLFGERWKGYGPYDAANLQQFIIHDAELAIWAKEMIGFNKAERNFHVSLFSMSNRLVRAFYKAMLRGDGSVSSKHGHAVLYMPSKHAAGQVQVLIARLGLCANIRIDDRTGTEREFNGKVMRHTKPNYIVSICRKTASLIQQRMQHSKEYVGKVYCPKTEDGLVFVRGTGIPFWAGNTHELIRHEVGTETDVPAIPLGLHEWSQTSGRYVRLDRINVAYDPILEGCEELVEAHIKQTEDLIYLLECKKGLRVANSLHPNSSPEEWIYNRHWVVEGVVDANPDDWKWVPNDKMPFDQKKKLTSAIRRFAMNGQVNEIFWSANVRALRHMIQMRTGRHAEWEIRLVFSQVYCAVKDKFPAAFGDAVVEIVDGMPEVSGMKTQPYAK